ncbi:hypothetical protein BN946_scf184982.g16 [Trametes cinnabarina]|uniref:Uncharacterized protein n=1 Tax=Pycnoporus cinnabarinus TaxID=5643 RepID=A0A060SPS8_PYCCI|nr:hypothetical protein BN946_scf184982.g16 [Trametes cinnabarina]
MKLINHFPPLPLEIVMLILEEVARVSHGGAYSVSLVSKWAYQLALPHLYATIVHHLTLSFPVSLSSGARQPLRRRSSRLFPTRYAHLVRNLWTECANMPGASPEEELIRLAPYFESVALLSSSLRTLSIALKDTGYAPWRKVDIPILCSLRSITIISHTFRYDWSPLMEARLSNGSQLLHNITHLRILDMKVSAFCPHELLPNLTHLALPFLDLGNNFEQRLIRLPDGVLQHPKLQMLVLTMDEARWLNNPSYLNVMSPGEILTSPSQTFRTLVDLARKRDDRLYIILSPRRNVQAWQEWAAAARGHEPSIWEAAKEARARDSHGDGLPNSLPQAAFR